MIKRLLVFLIMPFLALSGKLYGQDRWRGILAENIQEKIKIHIFVKI